MYISMVISRSNEKCFTLTTLFNLSSSSLSGLLPVIFLTNTSLISNVALIAISSKPLNTTNRIVILTESVLMNKNLLKRHMVSSTADDSKWS